MTRPRLSRAKIKAAIPNSGGVIARIARRTGHSWGAVRDFIAADEELSRMLRDEEEAVDDLAESVLIQKIREGDEATARWWLSRRRRNRYGDNVSLSGGDGALIVRVVYEDEKEQPEESA
ncbi:MAG: hypothetical protein KatS3mg038_1544 [Candidatus Kapaibacterium sp.]|nr:MAG: hypothetical protein KatS3mg038_1544 [Candidatus Kapabacteria bacterium]